MPDPVRGSDPAGPARGAPEDGQASGTIVSAGRVLTPARSFTPGWLHIIGEEIVEVAAGIPPRSADVALPDLTLVPGFVDAHVHGGGGASFMDGTAEAVRTVTEAHLVHGTTSMTASLVTDTPDRLASLVRMLADHVEEGALVGTHLEGPWLSPAHRGAHDPALLSDPTPERVEALIEAGRGTVRMATLAPELPSGPSAVRRLTQAGILAAVGHTDATYAEARAALDAGAIVGTHLFNAMRGVHHREPGPVIALLEDPDAYVELIADGIHLHPAVLAHAARAKPHMVVLVTDAMAAAAAPDGTYMLGPMEVRVEDRVARLTSTGAIAGSTLTLARAVRYAVQVAGLPLEDVVRAATQTPATMLGLGRVGQLRPGHRADVVALDAGLEVRHVMRAGRWVDRSAADPSWRPDRHTSSLP